MFVDLVPKGFRAIPEVCSLEGRRSLLADSLGHPFADGDCLFNAPTAHKSVFPSKKELDIRSCEFRVFGSNRNRSDRIKVIKSAKRLEVKEVPGFLGICRPNRMKF